MSADDFVAWQLVDSAFPTGAFAHSAGFEAWQAVLGGDGRELAPTVAAALEQTVAMAWPLARRGWQEPGSWAELDALAEASLSNHVAHRASRRQGQALVLAVEAAFPRPAFALLREDLRGDRHGHLAPLWGVVCGHLGIACDTCGQLLAYTALRDLLSAAVRLNVCGPLQAQALQARLAPDIPTLLARHGQAAVPVQTHPLLDLVQGMQDRLYSRLFSS